MEKIAMGLLSFMPKERDVKKLQETIQSYENEEDWHLYLWREEEDVLGAIGLCIEGQQAIIQHISVNPSHRNIGIGQKMVQSIREKYSTSYTIHAAELVNDFFNKCVENEDEE